MRQLILAACFLTPCASASAQQFCVASFLSPWAPPNSNCWPGICLTTPVSAENCEKWGGCHPGSPSHYSTNSMHSGSHELTAEDWYYLQEGWQNCGSPLWAGGGASFDANDVVFSGPAGVVAARVQFDYEFNFDWVRVPEPPGGVSQGGWQFRVALGFSGATSVSAWVWVFGSGEGEGGVVTGNQLGHGVQHLGGNRYRASGRYIGPEFIAPTNQPLTLSLRLESSSHQIGGLLFPGTLTNTSNGRVSLPSLGAVFVLPDGFTANSGQLGIVNNQFPPPPCDGDADGDFMVNFGDITSVLSHWGANYAPASGPGDANHDGVVDFGDITSALSYWGIACP